MDNVKQVVVGKTTKQQVLELFGPSKNSKVSGSKDIWLYKNFTQTKGLIPGQILEQKGWHLYITMENSIVTECKISYKELTQTALHAKVDDQERRCNE